MRESIELHRRNQLHRVALLVLLVGAWPSTSAAALLSVSGVPDPADPNALTEVLAGGPAENVAYNLANGFPLWYRDATGLKLELCLDQEVAVTATTSFFPCLTAEPFIGAPISFPTNFGGEAFWWSASTFGAFTSRVGGLAVPGTALLVLAQEAAFSSGLTIDGNQAAFGRIRLRIDVPVSGTYRITHPYGEIVYVVNAAGVRQINQTQDIGNLLPPAGSGAPPAGDFLAALSDGPDPATIIPPVGFPAINGEIVSSEPTGIGPFLVPEAPFGPITALDGRTYLTDPGTELVPRLVPVTNGPRGNALRIELVSTNVPDVFLNDADGSQVVEFDQFQVTGKIFDDGPNVRPIAVDDVAAATAGKPVVIDVVANDDPDLVGPGNAHALNPQALGLPSNDPADPPGTILLTRPLTTERGATVRRFTDFRNGATTFVYTPPAGFTGVDTFQYVVQDTGGLISAPATVTVTVEDLSVGKAEYRARNGKWHVSGTSSDPSDNSVALFGGPRANLAGAAVVPAVDTQAKAQVTLRLTPDAIDFRVTVDPAPATPVTQVFVHAGAPGLEGPPILRLYDRLAEPPFPGSKSGTATDAQRIFGAAQTQAGIESFADIVEAVLAGNAYVEIRTVQRPGGEIRGQLALPAIGTAAVDPGTSTWTFTGKAYASPGGVPASVNARSINGVWDLGAPLRVR